MAEPRLYLRLQSRRVDRTGKGGRKRRRRGGEADGGFQSPVKTLILPSIYMTNSILKQSCKWIIKRKEEQKREIVTRKEREEHHTHRWRCLSAEGIEDGDKASGRQAPLRKTAQSKLCHYAENFENV